MGRIIVMAAILILTSGCGTLYQPYVSSYEDPYKEIKEYNSSFFKVYHSDLRVWVGKNVEELGQAFTAGGSSRLDAYGNGTIIHEVINTVPQFAVHARLIFYVKNNKIYNVVKE